MEILNQSDERMLLLLGHNPFYKNKKYRLNKYCFIHDYKGVKLMLNELTRCAVAMSEEEFSKIYEIENAYTDPKLEFVAYLIDNFFLVLEDYNETEILDNLRDKLRPIIDDKYLKECYDFIVYPTTTCNARCFYCYENPMKKMPMSLDMADRVTRYIMKKAPNKEKELHLRWFGGEPLFNMKVMRYIMNMVKANGYHISTSIISNAYLFNEKIVKEAVEEWNLTNIQVTIDGTEEVYNKAKNYIYKNQDEVSPFKKVIENVGFLCESGINVSIRMNTDMYNADDLKELTRLLAEKYGHYNNLSTYCYAIFDDPNNPRSDKEREALYTKLFELEDVMLECNLLRKPPMIDPFIRVTHCMVDNGKCINIHPDGTLGLCEHYIDSDNWGYIDEDSNEVITNWEYVHEWREYVTDDFCKNCKIYPTCIRTKKCTDLADCHVWFQEFKYRRERQNLEAVYDKLLKMIEEGTSCCSGNSCGTDPNQSNTCYCISQRCDDKENWCYCISQRQETQEEEHCEECDKKKKSEEEAKAKAEEESNNTETTNHDEEHHECNCKNKNKKTDEEFVVTEEVKEVSREEVNNEETTENDTTNKKTIFDKLKDLF